MPGTKITEAEVKRRYEVIERHKASGVHNWLSMAAAELGIGFETLRSFVARRANRQDEPKITFPEPLDDDLPVTDLIRMAAKRAEKRLAAAAAKQDQVIALGTEAPTVIAFMGDPHVDDDGCDWPLLLDHIELLKRPGVYAVNVGDTTNNWTGRLMRLYAEQETSRKTARKMAKWLLTESGVRWLVWVMGNHDAWESGSDLLRLMNTTGIVMDDWSAKFRVRWANGVEVPFWVAHDFPGHSQWNRMHGLMKTAMMRGGAAVYAAGHRHVAGLHWEPLEDQGASFWALRSKGYKALDSHAVRLGYGSTDDGQTTAVVIDPRTKDSRELVQGFKSLRAAIDYRDAIA